jgi:hypothetical protein
MKNIIKSPVFFFVIIFIILLLLRLPVAVVPFFNIDEGIFATSANLIMNGQVYYRNAVDGLAPITPYFYSLIFLLFGKNNMFAVHVWLILLILCIAVTLYFMGVLIGKRKAGYLAAFLFCIFSYTFYEPDMLSFQTEWFVALFCSGGAYFLLKYFLKNNNLFLFLSGLSFGLAFFSKQPALFAYFAALLFCHLFTYAVSKNKLASVKAVILNVLGFSSVAAFVLFYFYINNALGDFWFWFWEYNRRYYVPATTFLQKIRSAFNFEESYFKINYLLLVLFFFNIFITALNTIKTFYKTRNIDRGLFIDWYLISWCILSYVGVCFSGRNFGHYYIMVLPAVCLVAGKAVFYIADSLNSVVDRLGRKLKNPALCKLIIEALLLFVVMLSTLDPLLLFCCRLRAWGVFTGKLDRETFVTDEFRILSDYIKKHSEKHEKIFVWGFAPELYSLANRLPASRYIYCNYLTGLIPWTNCQFNIDTSYAIVPGAWEIFMKEMNKNKPIYIIDTSVTNYRCYGKYPPEKFKELAAFLKENYTVETTLHIEKGDLKFRLFKRNIRPSNAIIVSPLK